MNLVHAYLLDELFWPLVDTGLKAEETPLFLGTYQGQSLAAYLADRFHLTPDQVELALEDARQEVEL